MRFRDKANASALYRDFLKQYPEGAYSLGFRENEANRLVWRLWTAQTGAVEDKHLAHVIAETMGELA